MPQTPNVTSDFYKNNQHQVNVCHTFLQCWLQTADKLPVIVRLLWKYWADCTFSFQTVVILRYLWITFFDSTFNLYEIWNLPPLNRQQTDLERWFSSPICYVHPVSAPPFPVKQPITNFSFYNVPVCLPDPSVVSMWSTLYCPNQVSRCKKLSLL